MDDIAHACGVSKRTLYEIFNDREELIGESLLHHASQIHKRSQEVTAQAENVLHAFWLQAMHRSKNLSGVSTLSEDLKRYYPKVVENLLPQIHEAVVHHTREKLSIGMEDGLILSNLDLDFFSRALTNYVYGLGVIEANTATTDVVITSQTVPTAILIFLRGISTEKGRRYIDENLLKNIIEK
jgi:AcrR family transcriptional regulator